MVDIADTVIIYLQSHTRLLPLTKVKIYEYCSVEFYIFFLYSFLMISTTHIQIPEFPENVS